MILYYKGAAILLSQTELRDLHRAFVTHVGASLSDLVSENDAVLAAWPPLRRVSVNPLTAFFLAANPNASETDLAGLPLFASSLEATFSSLLSGHSAALVRRVIKRTVEMPNALIQDQDKSVGKVMLDHLRRDMNWALWEPCCTCSSSFTQQPPPGELYRTLSALPTSNGLITNGSDYFLPPHIQDIQMLTDQLRHGLHEGLRHHRLVDAISAMNPIP